MKKLLSVLFALILVSSLFCVTAYAVEQPYDELVLMPDTTEKYVNSSLEAPSKKMTGFVHSSSTREVYFRMRYKKDTLVYKTDTAILIAPKKEDNWFQNRKSANTFNTNVYWRFELDNYGVGTKGGFAQGWMW